jgi:hypothetical protein
LFLPGLFAVCCWSLVFPILFLWNFLSTFPCDLSGFSHRGVFFFLLRVWVSFSARVVACFYDYGARMGRHDRIAAFSLPASLSLSPGSSGILRLRGPSIDRSIAVCLSGVPFSVFRFLFLFVFLYLLQRFGGGSGF